MANTKKQKKSQPVRRILSNRWVKAALVGAAVLIVLAIAWYFIKPYVLNPIPKDIRDQAEFTLYYPEKLPKGYSIDRKSFEFKQEEQVVLYKLTAKGKPNIFIASQPKPDNFNFDEFTEKKLSNQKGVITPLGKGILATAEGSKLISLPTEKGWVIISGKQELEDSVLEQLADRMREEK